jgi:hypothetical protein
MAVLGTGLQYGLEDGKAMKNPYELLRQKERDIVRVRTEIEALNLVIPLICDEEEDSNRAGFHVEGASQAVNTDENRHDAGLYTDTGVDDDSTPIRSSDFLAKRRLAKMRIEAGFDLIAYTKQSLSELLLVLILGFLASI